ncbi:hypothetical protein N8786_05090 [Candidatus Pelagibacter ubique]|nr:hypothetical protein [Candidatus Pelagibacter ubique]
MKKIIILFRRFNDFDHTVPIVNYISKNNPKIEINYLCTSRDWNFKENINYDFIKNLNNVKVDYFDNFFFRLIPRKILDLAHLNFIKILLKRIIKKKLSKLKLNLVLIDFPNPRKNFISEFVDATKDLKIKLVGFRHALWNRNISDRDEQDIKKLLSIVEENKDLDHLIFSNKSNMTAMLKYGKLDSNKALYLGNPRYSSNWHKKLLKHLKENSFKHNTITTNDNSNDKIKIVYMDHSASLGMNSEKIYNSVKKLINASFVDLIIKPNTNSLHKNDVNLSTNQLKEFPLDIKNNSVQLIDWADMVICTQSSIAAEVLLQKKILISASHYHFTNQLWDKYKAACCVKNDEELFNVINEYKKNRKNIFYNEQGVKNYLDEIQANELGGNTLERFNVFVNKLL